MVYKEVQFGKPRSKPKPISELETDLVDILKKTQSVGYLGRVRAIMKHIEKLYELRK